MRWARPQLYDWCSSGCQYSTCYQVWLSGPSFCLRFEKPCLNITRRNKMPRKMEVKITETICLLKVHKWVAQIAWPTMWFDLPYCRNDKTKLVGTMWEINACNIPPFSQQPHKTGPLPLKRARTDGRVIPSSVYFWWTIIQTEHNFVND